MIRPGIIKVEETKYEVSWTYMSGEVLVIKPNQLHKDSIQSSLCYYDNNYTEPYNKSMKRLR